MHRGEGRGGKRVLTFAFCSPPAYHPSPAPKPYLRQHGLAMVPDVWAPVRSTPHSCSTRTAHVSRARAAALTRPDLQGACGEPSGADGPGRPGVHRPRRGAGGEPGGSGRGGSTPSPRPFPTAGGVPVPAPACGLAWVRGVVGDVLVSARGRRVPQPPPQFTWSMAPGSCLFPQASPGRGGGEEESEHAGRRGVRRAGLRWGCFAWGSSARSVELPQRATSVRIFGGHVVAQGCRCVHRP